jgi:hypothetical protein
MDLKEEDILGESVGEHWYYSSKAAALMVDLRRYRPRSILDIGAGSGFFSRTLLRETSAVHATCVDIGYPVDRDETFCGKLIRFRRSVETSDADLVLLMDVMEHVPDEKTLISPYVDLVGRGTLFVITVPAFRFLWSGHDVFLGHYRRYTLAEIETVLWQCGLRVEWGHYYFAAVFPLAATTRIAAKLLGGESGEPKSQLKKHSVLTNSALSALCAAERPFMRVNRLFGLTAVVGCTKP